MTQTKGWKNIIKIIIPYFIIVGIFQIFVAKSILGIDISHLKINSLSTKQLLTLEFFSTVGTILVVGIFRTKIDKETFRSMGFAFNNIYYNSLQGMLFGILILTIGFVALLISNEIKFVSFNFDSIQFVQSVLLFLLVSLSEEILMRGYVLTNLLQSFNKYIALFISALLFSFMHLGNDNLHPIGIIGIFISGLFLGLGCMVSKSLWFSIALHFSWNFFQGTIYGFNISGNHVYSLITFSYTKQTIWNGGEFGFEASILAIILQIIFISIYLLRSNLIKTSKIESHKI
jgi:membrane protease YdiL (CAAX protease family)